MHKFITNPVHRKKLKQGLLYGSLSSCFVSCCLQGDRLGLLTSDYEAKSLELELETNSHALTTKELQEQREENKNLQNLLNIFEDLNNKLTAQRNELLEKEEAYKQFLRQDDEEIEQLSNQITTLNSEIKGLSNNIEWLKQNLTIEKGISATLDDDNKRLQSLLTTASNLNTIYRLNNPVLRNDCLDNERTSDQTKGRMCANENGIWLQNADGTWKQWNVQIWPIWK